VVGEATKEGGKNCASNSAELELRRSDEGGRGARGERLKRCGWEGEKKDGQEETAVFEGEVRESVPLVVCAEGDWAVAACDAMLSLSTSPGWLPGTWECRSENAQILDPALSLPLVVTSGKHDN
jgi:hypothetical protein